MSNNNASIDRLPPSSLEAEQGVLGCVMADPQTRLGECVEALPSGSEAFYNLKHAVIFDAMVALSAKGDAIDVITLQQHLQDHKQLEAVGGLAYLFALADCVPSAANLKYYLKILIEKHTARRIIRIASDLVADAYEFDGPISELVSKAESAVLSIDRSVKVGNIRAIGDGLAKATDTIEAWYKQDKTIGIPTGFPDFDKMTGGLIDKDMIVIAARPSFGKSSLSMNFAENIALECGLPVGVFSLEMSFDSLVLRTISSVARVNMRNIQEGFMSERDFPKITAAHIKLKKAPIYIDDTGGLSIDQLRARARRMFALYGIRVFIVDYLQLAHADRSHRGTKEEEMSAVSSGIKEMAKELNVPVIVLSQLNRDCVREKRRPNISDIRSSGQIEQDADVIGLLYRDGEDDDEDDQSDVWPMTLMLAKQRNGPIGPVDLTFIKQFTRFESRARASATDYNPTHNDP